MLALPGLLFKTLELANIQKSRKYESRLCLFTVTLQRSSRQIIHKQRFSAFGMPTFFFNTIQKLTFAEQPNYMKQRISQETIGRLVLIALTLLLLFLRFPDWFEFSPYKVIEPYGDGVKAYTNIMYHARHDSSWTYFEGMNYPYGEHASAAVTQPLVSGAIRLISRYIVDITPYTPPILNATLLLGLLLGVFFLYLCFRKMEVNRWWAIAASLGIAFLSPQLHRFVSHYGLAHIEVFPILFYLLMRLEEEQRIGISLWIGLLVTAVSLIHFYYFAILAMTLSLYFFIGFLRKPSLRRLLRYALHFGVQILLPLAFFYWWMYAGDTISDRSEMPWGFFYYHAIWESLVTSPHQPLFRWINEELIAIQWGSEEGQAYLGLVAVAGLLVLAGRWITRKVKGLTANFLSAGGTYRPFLYKMLLASFLLMLLSFGWPFTIPGLEWALEYTGPFRQFRSVGRFNWPFYYILNLVVLTELWYWCKKDNRRMALGVAALLLLSYEAFEHATARNLELDERKTLKPGQQFTDIAGIDYNDFQAVLSVPHFNIGSDQFWYAPEGNTMPWSLILGAQTGLPNTSAGLTRTSRAQTLKQLQLVNEPYRIPAVLQDYPNDKPLLMLLAKYQYSQHQEQYAHLLEGAYLLYENDQYALYRVPLHSFEDRIAHRIRQLEHRLATDTLSLYEAGGFISSDSVVNFYYQSFDEREAARTYQGSGAYEGDAAEKNIIFDRQIPRQYGTGWYSFSLWVFIDQDRISRGHSLVEEYDPETGEVLQRQELPLHQHIKLFDTDGWGMLEFRFIPKSSGSRIRWSIRQEKLSGRPVYLDELLIRHEINDIFDRRPPYLYYNNRWYLND